MKHGDTIIEPDWEADRKERERDAVRTAARELTELRGGGGSFEVVGPQSGEDGDLIDPWGSANAENAERVRSERRRARKEKLGAAGDSESARAAESTGARGATGTVEAAEAEEDAFAEKLPPSRLKQYLAGMLSGSILGREEVRRSYKYLIGIALLMMLYIYNVFYMQHLYRSQERLTEQVRELRAQAMTLSSMRMNATRQSAIVRELEARGSQVRESMTPPKVVEE